MQKWKLLSSEYLIQRPWATLRVDKLQMPNGFVKNEYYVLEYPNWVNMVGITEDDKILFIRQYRHGAEDIMLEIPAGVIEKEESPAEAAHREMLEETGYAFSGIEEICQLYANPATSGNITYTFLMTGGKKVQEQKLDESEDIEVALLTFEEAKKLLLDNKIGQALHSAALFYIFNKIQLCYLQSK